MTNLGNAIGRGARACTFIAAFITLTACGTDDSPESDTGSGGNGGGGSVSTGGVASTGGNASTGGASTGGSLAAPDAAMADSGAGGDLPQTTSEQQALGSCEGELLLRDYPVRIAATGLEAPAGSKVYGWVSFGLDYEFCSVLGETAVEGGAFELQVIATSNGGYFPDVAFWIDSDGDGTCDPAADVVFRSASSRGVASLDLELGAEDIADDFFNDEMDTACDPFDLFL